MVLYIVFVDTLYAWFYQFRTLIGTSIFPKLLLGKYRKPQTEKRIFLFIDMKDSTTHAERLGHVKFAELIQECFKTFGLLALHREVDIYQYVGDEVIVSWQVEEGIRNNNCLNLFTEFREKLLHDSDRLKRKFDLLPVFKAGMHIGEVTVAEIGVSKRGIEYLSDVLNTASRIQGKCNEHDTDFLISGEIRSKLSSEDDFDFVYKENVLLKGKTQKINLYEVVKK
jgi:adenylate cyclase